MPGRKHLKQSFHNLIDTQKEPDCHYLSNERSLKTPGSAGSTKSRNPSDRVLTSASDGFPLEIPPGLR